MEQSKNTIADNPVHDITIIIEESRDWKFDIDEKILMEKLIHYIVLRDGKVLEHGIKVGNKQYIESITI